MLKIKVITLFPDMFQLHTQHLPIKKALESNLIDIEFINLRNYAIDKRGTVDSPAYGGGPGMILRPEPIYNAVTYALGGSKNTYILFLTPRGVTYKQQTAKKLSEAGEVILVCGRYEGIDQRVIDHFKTVYPDNTHELSIGDYVLSGGEVAAMAVIESVVRLIPGAIENQDALTDESFNNNHLEHPQYARPEEWLGNKVPKILISGHHKNIQKWKADKSASIPLKD